MNKLIFAVIIIVIVDAMSLVMPKLVGLIGIVFGELTPSDIAQFTPQQRYTYDIIGQHMILLRVTNNTENNSTLTNNEIQAEIMEYFIVNGYSYCALWKDNQYGGYCTDTNDKSWYNDLVKKEYIEIIKRNQPSPFDALTNFFGSFSVYGSELYGL